MLRQIKNVFKKKSASSNVPATLEDAALRTEQQTNFNPYVQPQSQPQKPLTKDEQAKIEAQNAIDSMFSPAPQPEGVPTKQDPKEKTFKLDDYEAIPSADNADTLIMPPAPKKKPMWLVFITDVFNGCVLSVSFFAFALLLAESYFKDPYPQLAFLAFIPLGIAILNIRSAFASWFYGMASGTLFYLLAIYWIYPTVQNGTGQPALGGAAVVALSAILALQIAFFMLSAHFLKKVGWLFPITGAAAWVCWEYIHQLVAYNYLGFPWFVLGYTQYANQPLIQISSVTGAYGVSFAIVFFGLSIAYISGKRNAFARIIYFILPFAMLILFYSYGLKTIKTYEGLLQTNPQKVSVAIMQTNTHETLLQGLNEDVVYMIADQSAALKTKKVDLILWPESSYPGSFKDEDYHNFITDLSAQTHATQVTGSYVQDGQTQYVAAGLFDETGLKNTYYKVKLVPFGEFIPFTSLLNSVYSKYNITSLTGDFKPGNNPGKVFYITITDDYGHKKTFTFSTQICFESIFPSIWREQALNGAQFFANISNDGWFLDTAAAPQHLRANVFRAVENRRPVLRATNTGISAWVDSLGKIKFETKVNKQETVILPFYFQPRTAKTFYTLYGDIFAYCCIGLVLTILIFAMIFIDKKHD